MSESNVFKLCLTLNPTGAVFGFSIRTSSTLMNFLLLLWWPKDKRAVKKNQGGPWNARNRKNQRPLSSFLSSPNVVTINEFQVLLSPLLSHRGRRYLPYSPHPRLTQYTYLILNQQNDLSKTPILVLTPWVWKLMKDHCSPLALLTIRTWPTVLAMTLPPYLTNRSSAILALLSGNSFQPTPGLPHVFWIPRISTSLLFLLKDISCTVSWTAF